MGCCMWSAQADFEGGARRKDRAPPPSPQQHGFPGEHQGSTAATRARAGGGAAGARTAQLRRPRAAATTRQADLERRDAPGGRRSTRRTGTGAGLKLHAARARSRRSLSARARVDMPAAHRPLQLSRHRDADAEPTRLSHLRRKAAPLPSAQRPVLPSPLARRRPLFQCPLIPPATQATRGA